MKTLTQIGVVSVIAFALAGPTHAQEAVAPAPIIPAQEAPAPVEQQTPVPNAAPSRANNFNLPREIRYNGEVVTEGFWVITLCGKPVVFVYDTEGQMSVPLFGTTLFEVASERAWDVEGGPALLLLPDLATTYAPIQGVCEDLARADRKLQRDKDKVTPPATKMK